MKSLLWLSAHRWLAPACYAGVFITLVWLGYYVAHRNAMALGAALGEVQRLRVDSARAMRVVRVTDSVFHVDTVRMNSVRTRYQAIHDTLLETTTDTVTLLRFVSLADSTIHACTDAVESCTARVAARDSVIAIMGRQRGADRKVFNARLAAARPRVLPYVEALIEPNDTRTLVARGGIELRVVGPLRFVGAAEYDGRVVDVNQYHTTVAHRFRVLAGVRWVF